jgi:hypothetical protein
MIKSSKKRNIKYILASIHDNDDNSQYIFVFRMIKRNNPWGGSSIEA